MSTAEPRRGGGLHREITLPSFGGTWRMPGWAPTAVFWVILTVGVALRVYQFPHVPAGLNQDELSAGYEAWSLLQNGTDRWGYHLPAYFLSWGSGMNVLYSYLSVPFVALFGLTPVAIRMVGLLLGVGLLPLVYVTVKRLGGGRQMAAVAMLFAAVVPWAFMAARWGLEANILPFFLLLGVYTLTVGLSPSARTWQRLVAVLPFAVSLYAYAVAAVPVALLLILVVVTNVRVMRLHLVAWVGAYLVAALVAAPFALFIIKNNLLHASFVFEQWLPFSLPLLPESRLVQVNTLGPPFWRNVQAVLNGFQDYHIENSLVQHAPLPSIVRLLCLFEFGYLAYGFVRRKFKPRKPGIIGLWLLACVPLFWLFPLQTQRANVFLVPILIFAAAGFMHLYHVIANRLYRVVVAGICMVTLLVPTVGAVQEYFGPTYAEVSAANFHPDLAVPFEDVTRLAAGKHVYVSQSFNLNYMLTLWYTATPAAQFRAAQPTISAYDFGQFYFMRTELVDKADYYFLIPTAEDIGRECAAYKILHTYPRYKVGYCSSGVG